MVEMTGKELLNEIEKGIKEGERLFLFGLCALVFFIVGACACVIADLWISVAMILVTGCFTTNTVCKTYSLLCEMYFEKGQIEALFRLECMVNDR